MNKQLTAYSKFYATKEKAVSIFAVKLPSYSRAVIVYISTTQMSE